jgi:hypothetical protein
MAPKKRSGSARSTASRASQGSFWQTVKLGFAVGIGAFAASLIFILVGLGILLGGYTLRNKEQAKPEKEQKRWKINLGLGLMFLGVVIAGGAGAASLLGEVSEEF